MKTILLTGSAGFIEHKTPEFLLRDSYRIIGVDNMNDYYDEKLKEYHLSLLMEKPNFEFYNIDIENQGELKPLFESKTFDAIMNIAARAGVSYNIENSYIYVSSNL